MKTRTAPAAASVRGPDEALLWAADAVCGAVVRDRAGDGAYLQAIAAGAGLQMIQISPA